LGKYSVKFKKKIQKVNQTSVGSLVPHIVDGQHIKRGRKIIKEEKGYSSSE